MNFENIICVIIVIIIVYIIRIYNKFISLRVNIDASWSDINVQLKRRYNLISVLVKMVKGYNRYENETLEKIIKVRQQAISANTLQEKESTTNILTGALNNIFALSEAYPELKANISFMNLQMELSNVENSLQNARRYYNASVRNYNAKLNSFPDLILSRIFNFEPRQYFELDENIEDMARKMPEIN